MKAEISGGKTRKPPRDYPTPSKPKNRLANQRGVTTAHKALQPAQSNKGGATRGKARAAQVKASKPPQKRIGKPVAKPLPAPTKTSGSRNRRNGGPTGLLRSPAKRTRKPGTGLNINLNPFDAVGGLGQGIRDAFGNLAPQDSLFKGISENIRRATKR